MQAKPGSGSSALPPVRQPSARPPQRREGVRIGAGQQHRAVERRQRREQVAPAFGIQVDDGFVQQQQRRRAARRGDQRGMAQYHAQQQRLLLPGAGQGGGQAGLRVEQRHVCPVRPQPGRPGRGIAGAGGVQRVPQPILHGKGRVRVQPLGDRVEQGHPGGGERAGRSRGQRGIQPSDKGAPRGRGGNGVAHHAVLQPG